MIVFLGTLGSSIKQIEVPYVFDSENRIALHTCREIGPQHSPRGKSLGFSQVAVRTWDVFSSYSGEVHSKLEFVQRSQDTCLSTEDTSGR